jgi:pimeloyl-ACP methyl ester carboxylesterase
MKQHATGRIRLERDNMQWDFDRTVGTTGRVFHFQRESRGPLPPSIRSHRMISKHLARGARRLEQLAAEEAAAGHRHTALELYFDAAMAYGQAQHPIFSINKEKRLLHESSIRCYDQVRALAPYVIEHLQIDWEDTAVSGNLHLLPGAEPAPCVFFIPGCDMTKEMHPHPMWNHAHQRGMHIFSFDGPGQGESNLRDIALTADNYESAASAAITALLARPEITEIVVYGISFGSYWGLRLAATDDRVRALAAPWASFGDKYYLMTEESPRFEQLFAHLTRAESEEQLSETLAGMDNYNDMARITCPAVFMTGEYDPRSPIEETLELFSKVTAPAELWVFADQHHMLSLVGSAEGKGWMNDIHAVSMDWLADRVNGRPMKNVGEVLYLEPGGGGPNGSSVAHKGQWFD